MRAGAVSLRRSTEAKSGALRVVSTGTGEVVRTQEERFAALPGFPWRPRYREVGGLMLAHIDEGDGAPIVLLHGEPSWSFL